jgi:hypothetical protein
MRTNSLTGPLAALVVIHFFVAVVHGVAHGAAHISLSLPALAFVIVVIQLGPLAGLALMRPQPRIGAAIVAVSMAGALLFGLVNHFMLPGADHVMSVDTHWRMLFGSTAVVLAITEAGAAIVGTLAALRYERSPS